MGMKLMILLGGLFIALASACSLGTGGSTEVYDDSFVVGNAPMVVVSGENGRIIVNSGSEHSVSVKATLRKAEEVEYSITQEGDVITVVAKTDDGGLFDFGKGPGADIEITTPPNTAVDLRTSNGHVEVYGMQRSGTVHTSNGRIVLDDVSGDFVATTKNGGVTITDATGSFDVETINGRIKFDGELTRGTDNKMTTSNGSVEIVLRGTPSVKLDGSTSNGSVTSDYPILTTSAGDKHHLIGIIGDGESTLMVRTSNGSVVIRPSDSLNANASSVISNGAPRANLTYEGAVYYATSQNTDEAANFSEDELEVIGETSESNLLFPGRGETLDIYKLNDGEDGFVYTLESGTNFENEDGDTVTIEAEWVRWIAAESKG
jgi:hypothetical protein